MLRGNYFWKEDGCRIDFSTLVGGMRVSAKTVTRKKAQKSTGSTIVQNGTELDEGILQVLSESGSKKREPQRRSGSGQEVSLRILSVKANGTGVKKWESEKHKSWCMPLEEFKGHVATDVWLVSGAIGL